ncbi:MAG: MATE family efflux transporter [Clostridia bacterium]
MQKDLTVGKPFSVLIRYALPLFGSIVFQQLYNIADSLIAGRYIGTSALAAVGNSYEITLIFIAFAFGCNIGSSVVVAKYFGSKDLAKAKTTIYTAVIFSSILGVVLTTLGLVFANPLLRLINTPENIFVDSSKYLLIYIGGYLFLLLYNIANGIFSALGDSKTPFILLVISSISNVIMDIVFVKYLHLGVSGVAWATFICQGVCGTVALVYALIRTRKIFAQKVCLFDFKILKEISQIAIPSILQQSFISVGNIVIQSFINAFGMSAIGGYAAAVKLNNMTITSITAIGSGVSNFTSQNLGANKPERIKTGFISGIVLSCICAVIFIAIYIPFGATLVRLFIIDGDVTAIEVGKQFLLIISPFYVVIAIKLVADGVLRGANKMGCFMISTLTDLVIRVAFSAIFAKSLGINGIWWSWPIGWVIASIISLGLFLYVQKSLLKNKLEEIEI